MNDTPSPTLQPRPLGHLPALDGLRAVAALLVVLFHARITGFANGSIGVHVFFVLSGFVSASILLEQSGRSRRIDCRRFYRRRALRLLPAYFSVVILCVLLAPVSDIGGTVKGAVVSTFYLANWVAAFRDEGLG